MSVCHLANRLVCRNTHTHTLIHMASAAYTMIQMVSLAVRWWGIVQTSHQMTAMHGWFFILTGIIPHLHNQVRTTQYLVGKKTCSSRGSESQD